MLFMIATADSASLAERVDSAGCLMDVSLEPNQTGKTSCLQAEFLRENVSLRRSAGLVGRGLGSSL